MAEEDERLPRRQVEHLGDVPPPVGDLQDLGAIARAPAVGTAHHHVGQELHVDRQEAVSLAGAAPAPLDVEAEHARAVVAQLGLVGRGEGPADLVERLQVGDRVRSTRPADRRLVEEDRVLDLAGSRQLVERRGRQRLPVQPLAQRGVERLLDQRALARSADAGDDAEHAQRERDVDRLEVVAPGARSGSGTPGKAGAGMPGISTRFRPARKSLVSDPLTSPNGSTGPE